MDESLSPEGITINVRPGGGSPAGPRVIPSSEITFRSDTSGGPGGQHANRSSTRVTLLWDFQASGVFSEAEKARLAAHCRSRLSAEGELKIRIGNERSQTQNKRACVELLASLVEQALEPRRRRVPTRPTRGSKERRLEGKQRRSEIKSRRRPPRSDDS